MAKFEIIEHTADVGIRAWGDSIEEAFENAALGMFSIIADVSKVDLIGEAEVRVNNESLDELLVDWLSELLYLFDAERIFLGKFEVKIDKKDRYYLKGRVYGEKYDPKKHGMGVEIKAVTYHMLKVDTDKNEVEVLFDI
jgi:SHS2 domain-containing protein